jgi:hypothetical protein
VCLGITLSANSNEQAQPSKIMMPASKAELLRTSAGKCLLIRITKLTDQWRNIEHLSRHIRNSYDPIVDCSLDHRRDIDSDSNAKSGRHTGRARQHTHNQTHAEIYLAYHQRAGDWHCVSSISLHQISRAYAGSCLCFKSSVADFFRQFRRINRGLKSQTSFVGCFSDRINFDLAWHELT